jgi:type I restriction enzyme R subunit
MDIIALEKVRVALRDLIKFIDREGRKDAYTDFEDIMGDATEVKDILSGSNTLEGYRKRFEKYIRENENHIAVSKLKYNKPLTIMDINELEKMLFNEKAPGSREDFEKIYGSDKPLGYFIRNIVGLDRNAAKEAFSGFMEKAVLNPQQISFVDRIIDYLTQNGILEPDKLFEPPFTDIHSVGVVGVFHSNQVGLIFNIIKSINMNAGIAG